MEILLSAALIPPIFLIALIWKTDKLEKEPVGLIVKVTIFGALSGIVAYFGEIGASFIISSEFAFDYDAYLIADNFLGVALIEELVKWAVIMWFVWRHYEFDCLFDGVVYGAAASLGFAALENVMYTFSYGISTAIVRAFTAIPGHMVFGIMMGVMISLAKEHKLASRMSNKWMALIGSLAIPTIFHGFYDYLLSDPFYIAEDIWYVYFVLAVIAAFIVIRRTAKHDRIIVPKREPILEKREDIII